MQVCLSSFNHMSYETIQKCETSIQVHFKRNRWKEKLKQFFMPFIQLTNYFGGGLKKDPVKYLSWSFLTKITDDLKIINNF